MKKLIVLGILEIILLTGCSSKIEDKVVNQKSIDNGINQEQVLDEFIFKENSITYEDGISTIRTLVTNNSDEDKYIELFKIILKDNTGKVVKETIGYIGDTINAKSSKVITTKINLDLSSISMIEYSYSK